MKKKRKQKPIEYVVDENGCHICTSHATDIHGYPHVWRDGKGTTAHRFIYEEHVGPIPFGLLVRHKCDVRKCINPDHLELGTNADNSNDCKIRGRLNTPKGEARSDTKLTDAQIEEIRGSSMSQTALAKKFGVGQPYISRVVRNLKRVAENTM